MPGKLESLGLDILITLIFLVGGGQLYRDEAIVHTPLQPHLTLLSRVRIPQLKKR